MASANEMDVVISETTSDDLPELINNYSNVLITIGQIKNSKARSDIFDLLKRLEANLPVISSPHSYISNTSTIDEGCIIMHGAIVNSQSRVHENCVINNNALIEHDVVIEKNCHISTGAIINGEAYIDSGVFIGSGSTESAAKLLDRDYIGYELNPE